VIPDHAAQTVRSGNAPYRNGKNIYYVYISFLELSFLMNNGLTFGAVLFIIILKPPHPNPLPVGERGKSVGSLPVRERRSYGGSLPPRPACAKAACGQKPFGGKAVSAKAGEKERARGKVN
jgi:hypothetical protein